MTIFYINIFEYNVKIIFALTEKRHLPITPSKLFKVKYGEAKLAMVMTAITKKQNNFKHVKQ